MLPILKRHKEASVTVTPDSVQRKPDSSEETFYDPHHSAAEDLHNALKHGDIKGISEALKASHAMLSGESHEEHDIGEDKYE
jgi:hypothetical protein